jgi:hypothetical protein
MDHNQGAASDNSRLIERLEKRVAALEREHGRLSLIIDNLVRKVGAKR